MHELFVTDVAADAPGPGPLGECRRPGRPVTDKAAAALSDTVTPRASSPCAHRRPSPLSYALAGTPRLVAVLVGVADPGNAGTVMRVADAAGADAVLLAGDAVDPHNGKCVRASTGASSTSLSCFPATPTRCWTPCGYRGLSLVATAGYGKGDLDTADYLLGGPPPGCSAARPTG